MENCATRKEFIAFMAEYGYKVRWEPNQKYITYTTPENVRCRDNKLFDQTLLRSSMEAYSPKWPDGKKHARNVYAHTREECEEKLKVLIVEMKAEIAEAQRLMDLGEGDGRPPKNSHK